MASASRTPDVASSPVAAPLGLLAGSGRFPVVVAEKARRLGLSVVCVAIRSEATPGLADLVDEFHWVRLAAMGQMIRRFKQAGCQRVVMAGKITKAVIHSPWRWVQLCPDLRTIRYWYRRWRNDNRDDSLLLGVVREFALDGLTCESALDLCPELLVGPGPLTGRHPSPDVQADIEFGWQLARLMGGLDIGQSVVVQGGRAIAIEAIEGTDQAIRRAGALAPGALVAVKVAKPEQDMRFDVPTVGTATIENLHRAGASTLAIEAGRTIVIDQAEVAALADQYGMTVVALAKPEAWQPPPPAVPFRFRASVGQRQLTETERADLGFAWEMAGQMSRFPVGRTIAVKEKSVIAVQAIEPAEETIRRAGQLCRGSAFTVLQAQPTSPPSAALLQVMAEVGGRVLGTEAELPPGPELARIANRHRLSLVQLGPGTGD